MALAELIRRHRQSKLLTQEDAADRCGIAVRSLRRYEAGELPSPHSARAIANGLGISESELVAAMTASPPAPSSPGEG